MGKRKGKKAAPKKKKTAPLDTTFTCLFCNHEKTVRCEIDKQTSIATLNCQVCGQSHQCMANALTAPIDIYSDWIDACDAVARRAAQDTDQVDQPTSRVSNEFDDFD